MDIVEFPVFTRAISALLSDEEYAEVRWALIRRPEIGYLIPGCKGLRKVRWVLPGKGKNSGIREIYYWITASEQILMLFAYAKNQQDNFTEEQKQILVKLIEEQLKYE